MEDERIEGDFDDILGEDDPEKKHKEWVEENKTEKPSNKSFRTLNDVYQKAQKRWQVEDVIKEQLKKEMSEKFDKAKSKLDAQKDEFEKEYKIDFTEKEIKANSDFAKEINKGIEENHKRWKKGMGIG